MFKCTGNVSATNEYWIYISASENSLLFSSCHQSIVLITMFEFGNRRQAKDSDVAEEGLPLAAAAAGRWGWIKLGFLVCKMCFSKEMMWLMLDSKWSHKEVFCPVIQLGKWWHFRVNVLFGFERAAEPGLGQRRVAWGLLWVPSRSRNRESNTNSCSERFLFEGWWHRWMREQVQKHLDI